MKDCIVNLGKALNYTQEEIDQALDRKGKGGPTSPSPLGFDWNYVLKNFDGNLR